MTEHKHPIADDLLDRLLADYQGLRLCCWAHCCRLRPLARHCSICAARAGQSMGVGMWILRLWGDGEVCLDGSLLCRWIR